MQVRVLQRLRRRRDLHPHRAHTGLVRILCVYVCACIIIFLLIFWGGHGLRDEWMYGFIVRSKYTIDQRSKNKTQVLTLPSSRPSAPVREGIACT